jgi:hypothetical protein
VAAPDLADRFVAARTSVSHPGAEGPGTLTRYWLGEALTWVLRMRLLAELGVPVSDLSASVIRKPSFQEALSELSSLRPCPGERKWLIPVVAVVSPGNGAIASYLTFIQAALVLAWPSIAAAWQAPDLAGWLA